MASSRPILIAGMERSETSLLRAALGRHSRLALPERGELQFFQNWWEDGAPLESEGDLSQFAEAFFTRSKFWALGVDREDVLARFREGPRSRTAFFTAVMESFADSRCKPRWGEKSTSHIFHLDVIRQELPSAQILLVSRNPLDTFVSTRSAPWRRTQLIEAEPWAKEWARTYARAVQTLERSEADWMHCRHENLVLQPRETLQTILTFLDKTFEPDCAAKSAAEIADNSSFHAPLRGFDARSIGRWRERLTTQEVDTISTGAAGVLPRLGYARSLDDVSLLVDSDFAASPSREVPRRSRDF